MKKFVLAACAVVGCLLLLNFAYYHMGFYIDLHPNAPITSFTKTEEKTIYIQRDGEYRPFEVRGVNLGVGIPGKWATDYAIDEQTYLRWFGWIQEMGANTIRVYTILQDDFYNAFYTYNRQREAEGLEPLWLIHGVWVNDYIQNSHRDAYDDDFRQAFLEHCLLLVDVLHGHRTLSLGRDIGSGSYRRDVSPWVIGYILGVEWEDVTVAYTDEKYPERNRYAGTYLYTTEEATPFEAMLAEVGDRMIAYETERYKQQRLIAFSNWPTTDPFTYSEEVTYHFKKCAQVDVEHIRTTDAFLAGQFASYHVYPYYPDYLHYETDQTGFVRTEDGGVNTYQTYLKQLNDHHTMPVVIAEFGVSTGRGMAQRDANTGRNQGNMSEKEQGQALIDCFEDIMAAGCAGGCIFTWQDEWFKRTWNTMHAVDLDNTPYWSDYQTNEQYFGLLAFDPGEEESVCYVDGDLSEWTQEDVVLSEGGLTLSMKYDERFLYFMVQGEAYNPEEDILYLPIDTTQKTGSTYCENYDLTFERACDFVVCINGRQNSRVLVQERYEVLRATYLRQTTGENPYTNPVDANTPTFKPIKLILQTLDLTSDPAGGQEETYEVYETGRLTYGNGNPEDPAFHSLADYIFTENGLELRLPWQLLNFSNPAQREIHDDYYEHYGVKAQTIEKIYVGVATGERTEYRIPMEGFALKSWGKTVHYHERLKQSYYQMKDYWSKRP